MRTAKPNNQSTLICAQIRIGGTRPNHESDYEFNKIENINVVWKFINESLINNDPLIRETRNFKLFVTTDSELVLQDAFQFFGNDTIVLNDGSIKHIDRDLSGNLNTCSPIQRTILDFHSLQNCDKAVVTHSSGFGILGVWNRKEPFKNLYIYQHPNIIRADDFDEKNIAH